MVGFDGADGNAFVLEQRVGTLMSQLAELEDLRARVLEAEQIIRHRQTIAAFNPRLNTSRRSSNDRE